MLNVISQQGNANQNNEVTPTRDAIIKKQIIKGVNQDAEKL